MQFRKQKQEDFKFQARLQYIARTCPSSMDTKGWEGIDKGKQEIRKGREEAYKNWLFSPTSIPPYL